MVFNIILYVILAISHAKNNDTIIIAGIKKSTIILAIYRTDKITEENINATLKNENAFIAVINL